MKFFKRIILFLAMIIVFNTSVKVSFNLAKSKVINGIKNEIGLLGKDDDLNDEVNNINSKDIKNVLLLGADFRKGENYARTDTMMILTLDSKNNKVKLTSLLRDMLVNIEGKGKSKLNHAFAFGGVDLTIKTIEDNFGIHIDNYMMIDFNGFMDIVNELGGVTVNVQKQDLNDFNKYIDDVTDKEAIKITEPGVQKLNGTQALTYCRIRKSSGGEDRRTERQREVINSIIQSVKETNILKYPSLIKIGLEYLTTDLGLSDTLDLAYKAIKLDLDNIQNLKVPFDDVTVSGSWKNYGWVFRTDLDITTKLLQDYIYNDIEIDTSDIDKSDLNYIE